MDIMYSTMFLVYTRILFCKSINMSFENRLSKTFRQVLTLVQNNNGTKNKIVIIFKINYSGYRKMLSKA